MPGRWHVSVPALVQTNGDAEQIVFAAVFDDAAPTEPLFYGRLNDANMGRFSSIINASGEAGY